MSPKMKDVQSPLVRLTVPLALSSEAESVQVPANTICVALEATENGLLILTPDGAVVNVEENEYVYIQRHERQ